VGGTLSSERLYTNAYAFGGQFATSANVHALAAASFTLDQLEVVGYNGPGYVEFQFDNTWSGTIGPPGGCSPLLLAAVCLDIEEFAGPISSFRGDRFTGFVPSLFVPFSPGVTFSFTATLGVYASAGGGLGTAFGDQLAQGTATATLRSISVLTQGGFTLVDASVVELPEPASLLLVAAGAALLAALRRRRGVGHRFLWPAGRSGDIGLADDKHRSSAPHPRIFLGIFLAATGLAHAGVVATADPYYGLFANPCPAGTTSAGATTASASAQCAIGGDISTASASVTGGTLGSDTLSASVSLFGGQFVPTGYNVHAIATASFTLDNLQVVGDSVPGWVEFNFDFISTWSGNVVGCNPIAECMDVQLFGGPDTTFPNNLSNFAYLDVPYIPGEPSFSFRATLGIHGVVSSGIGNCCPGPGSGDQVAQGTATATLQSIRVIDVNGRTVLGASVVQPEPASLFLVAAGVVLLARRRGRPRY
jgi:hypothetical protein